MRDDGSNSICVIYRYTTVDPSCIWVINTGTHPQTTSTYHFQPSQLKACWVIGRFSGATVRTWAVTWSTLKSPNPPVSLPKFAMSCVKGADHIKFRPTTSTRSGKPQLTHPSRRAYLWLKHVEGTFPMKLKPNELISDMYDMMACWVRIILATIKWSPLLVQEYCITCFFASWSLFDHCKSDVWCCQNGKDKDPYK